MTTPLTIIGVALLAVAARPQPIPRRSLPRHEPRARRRPAIVVFVAVFVWSPVLALCGVLAVVIGRRWRALRAQRSTRSAIRTAFPELLDLLVLSIRAGSLPARALDEVSPFVDPSLGDAVQLVSARLRDGDRFADALEALRVELGAIAEPLVDSLAAADRYGLPLAPVLERLSAEARDQRRRATEAAARELPVRLAMPLVLCTLPSYVLLAIAPLLLGAFSSLRN